MGSTSNLANRAASASGAPQPGAVVATSSHGAAGRQDMAAEQPHPMTTDTVEPQLRRVEERLLAETEGDAVAQFTVRNHLAEARARFANATVRQFLPILVEREVRRRMREGAVTGQARPRV